VAEQHQGSDIVMGGGGLKKLLGGLENCQTQILCAECGRSLETFLRALQAKFLVVVLGFNDSAGHQQKSRARAHTAGRGALGGMGKNPERKAAGFQLRDSGVVVEVGPGGDQR
jgi:hypothetical protein